jgi:hypothetical protein
MACSGTALIAILHNNCYNYYLTFNRWHATRSCLLFLFILRRFSATKTIWQRVVPAFGWRYWGKPRKPSVRIASVQAKIWTRDLLNTKQSINHSTTTSGATVVKVAYTTLWADVQQPSKYDSGLNIAGQASNQSTPWIRSASSRSAVHFHAFYGTRRFIIMFTVALLSSQSWAAWIQSTP